MTDVDEEFYCAYELSEPAAEPDDEPFVEPCDDLVTNPQQWLQVRVGNVDTRQWFCDQHIEAARVDLEQPVEALDAGVGPQALAVLSRPEEENSAN